MSKKTIKVPFEIIIRNKKTKQEIKVGDLSVPITFSVNKRMLHEIMKDNVRKEVEDDDEYQNAIREINVGAKTV